MKTQIKICGITNFDDAMSAVEAGADMLGFNFYPPSPRYIPVENCVRISEYLSKNFPTITRVGVFVNKPILEIIRIIDQCQLNLVQLHGNETPGDLRSLNGIAYKAFRGNPSLEIISTYLYGDQLPSFLLDAPSNSFFGGSGKTGDWLTAAQIAKKYPLLLAGGLTSANVGQAVKEVNPWGVDVASGVEKYPGKKDSKKMIEFVNSVKSPI